MEHETFSSCRSDAQECTLEPENSRSRGAASNLHNPSLLRLRRKRPMRPSSDPLNTSRSMMFLSPWRCTPTFLLYLFQDRRPPPLRPLWPGRAAVPRHAAPAIARHRPPAALLLCLCRSAWWPGGQRSAEDFGRPVSLYGRLSCFLLPSMAQLTSVSKTFGSAWAIATASCR